MDEIEKIKEELKFLKFSTEEEFNKIDNQFKANLEYIKSETEKTESMTLVTNILKEFMVDVHQSFETKKVEINTINIKLKTLETLIETQNIKLKTIEEILSSIK